ncbi:MAG: hypothetical protein GY797_38735 [Deltaproteobacteria bacterium]|nr:hypothetical protein [Deltaproteobacteria bacterium]
MQFVFYSDPGHGWVKVPVVLLRQLKITDKISRFSYCRGDYAYLEEDSDAGIFIEAMKKASKEVSFKESSTDRQSRIRNYNSYEKEKMNG